MEEAKSTYARLASETSRLAAVKEQICIRYLGLGWVQAHHTWSENGNTFTARRLLKHLVEVVIPLPLAEELDVPPEPPVNVPKIPEMKVLGTVSELGEDAKKLSDDKLLELRKNGNDLRDQRGDNGDGDQWYEKNKLLPPEISDSKDFRMEMLFAYNGDDGTQ